MRRSAGTQRTWIDARFFFVEVGEREGVRY